MIPENLLNQRLVDTDGAAAILAILGVPISSPALRVRRSTGNGPAFRKGPGGRVFYEVEDLKAWVDQALSPRVHNTAEARTIMRRAAGTRG